ncbi:SDR family NAD(P)-dependent oxidoreductase [Qipengyuania sp.]|uniref:SDR family NAD(P)-dependent oxidoreductase n=1 Tax=Qipengyuania sp. TaxID=2004515 RepID=UPI0035C7E98F
MNTEPTMIVTGAGSGIGRAVLMHFAAKGWRVAGLDKDQEALEELRGAFADSRVLLHKADVGKEDEVQAAFVAIADWLDGDALGALINNAGIADPYSGPLEELSLADFQTWIDASLTAAFLCSRAAVPLMKRGRTGAIVNISSTRAVMSEPECFGYAAAKGGLDALTHAMAVSLGPEIRVNTIRPGWIETGPWQKEADRSEPSYRKKDREQHPAGRVGRPEDIAETVAWLVSAGFVTGQAVNVDGGMTVKMIYAD